METTCDEEYARVAHELVDIAISRAFTQLAESGWCDLPLEDYVVPAEQKRRTHTDRSSLPPDVAGHMPNISWPTIEDFTPDTGTEKILEFIKTWEYEDNWLYCIDLTGTDDLEYDTRYRYRVRWSIPTRRLPIPRFTASVYFTITVSKIKPKDYPIDVFYVFEGNRLVHRPGHSRFDEEWLKDIVESKMIIINKIDF